METHFVLSGEPATMTEMIKPGTHILIDFWGASHLGDAMTVEQALRAAAHACDVNVLAVTVHHFGPGCGVTALALLAESHASIHTWPEVGYLAADVFTCGNSDPHLALPVLRAAFTPQRERITEHRRG